MEIEPGATYTVERTFTEADVAAFADVTRDRQDRHTDPEDGRPLVHGLLTASLATEIGGDLEVLARRMEFSFRRPVYAGETVTCEWENERVEDRGDRLEVLGSITCRNGDGEVVLAGEAEGVVFR